jgi:hypothetical protein
MNTVELLMAMIFAHFVADWTLQTEMQAKNKAKYSYIMGLHSFVWTFCLFIPLMMIGYHIDTFIFIMWTVIHFWVDTWKCWIIRDWSKEEDNWDMFKPWHLYVDQGIHFAQVVGLWAMYVYGT